MQRLEFCQERIRPIVPGVSPRRGGRAVTNDFSVKRAKAFKAAKAAVESERYRVLLISLLEWVANKRSYSGTSDGAWCPGWRWILGVSQWPVFNSFLKPPGGVEILSFAGKGDPIRSYRCAQSLRDARKG
jgi:hypothetical protein